MLIRKSYNVCLLHLMPDIGSIAVPNHDICYPINTLGSLLKDWAAFTVMFMNSGRWVLLLFLVFQLYGPIHRTKCLRKTQNWVRTGFFAVVVTKRQSIEIAKRVAQNHVIFSEILCFNNPRWFDTHFWIKAFFLLSSVFSWILAVLQPFL